MTRGLPMLTTFALVAAFATGVVPAAASEPDPPPETLADRLVEAAEAGADPAELAEAVGLPADGPNSLVADAAGVAATVTFETAPTSAAVAAVEALARVDRVYRFSPALAVTVDPARLDALAALDGVRSVVPVVRGATAADAIGAGAQLPPEPGCRTIPVEADGPLGTAQARSRFGVDGTGVKVGIISDSYGIATEITTPADDVAAGALPGPGNPCGYTAPVTVLFDADEGEDEGRAMAQLVHGVAPGAELLFATGWGGPYGMVEAIYSLAMAGADVIVDDLSYASETYFQKGLISVAIDDVRSQGIAYYTSAGNGNVVGADDGPSAGLPIAGWQTEAYRGTECPAWVWVHETVADYDCLDFDPSPAEDPVELLGLNGVTSPQFLLSWGEPINGVRSSFSLQLYTDDDEPLLYNIGTTHDAAIPNETLAFGIVPPEGTYRLVLVRDLTEREPNDPALWIGTFVGGAALDWREYDSSTGPDRVGPAGYGHGADGSAVSIAAVDWEQPDVPEYFSSPGTARLLFEPLDPLTAVPSAAYPEPVLVSTPYLAGVDGTRTSFFGDDHRFYGTSAAAPHVAAMHALAAEYAPDADAEAIVAALVETAAPLTNPHAGVLDDAAVFGAGLADGVALLGALPARSAAGVTAVATSPIRVQVSWAPVAGAAGYVVEVHRGADLVATAEAAGSPVEVAGLEPSTEHTVRVAARNAAGEPGPWTHAVVGTPALPPGPDQDPVAPSGLTESSAGGLAIVWDGGSQAVVSNLPGETWAAAWLYSTPQFLGWVRTDADGVARVPIPSDLEPRAHRLAFLDADGELLGWVGFEVAAPAPSALANSGTEPGLVLPAAALLLAGIALAAIATRRRTAAG